MSFLKKHFVVFAFAATILFGAGISFAATATHAPTPEIMSLDHHHGGHWGPRGGYGPRGGCGW